MKEPIEIGADREYIDFLRITNQSVATPEEVTAYVNNLFERISPETFQTLVDEGMILPADADEILIEKTNTITPLEHDPDIEQ